MLYATSVLDAYYCILPHRCSSLKLRRTPIHGKNAAVGKATLQQGSICGEELCQQ